MSSMRFVSVVWVLGVLASLAVPEVTSQTAPPGGPSVAPAIVSVGTLVTITGTGFGEKQGAVDLTTPGVKKRHRLKPISWSDTTITAEVTRAKLGDWTLTVRPKGKALPDQQAQPVVTVSPFVLQEMTPSTAMPGMQVVLRGPYLGKRKGRVRVGIWRAKVTRWEAVVEDPGDGGPPVGEVAFLVPKKLVPNFFDVEIKTPTGTTFLELALEVLFEGNFSPLMKPIMWATIDGKRLVARGKRAFLHNFPASDCQDFGVSGGCLAAVGAKSNVKGIVIIFLGWDPSDGPAVFSDENCIIGYLAGKRTYAAPGGGVLVNRTMANFTASGAFEGSLELIDGSGPPELSLQRGRFYDLR